MTTDQTEQFRQVRRVFHGLALWYSLALAYLWILIQTGAMLFIIPKLSEAFADFEFELPRVTKWLVAASAWMVGDQPGQIVPGWMIAVPVAFVVVTALFVVLRRVPLLLMILAPLLVASLIAQAVLLFAPLYTMVGDLDQL